MADGPYDDFQSRASKIGGAFAKWCEITFRSSGFSVQGKMIFWHAGGEIDQVATNWNGQHFYFRSKGAASL